MNGADAASVSRCLLIRNIGRFSAGDVTRRRLGRDGQGITTPAGRRSCSRQDSRALLAAARLRLLMVCMPPPPPQQLACSKRYEMLF